MAEAMLPTSDLSRSRIFDGLTDSERQAWLSQATMVAAGRGQVLARQGDPAQRFFLVETGLLKVVQLTSEGQSLIVRFVGPGEPFGGVVALDGATYPVTALAVEAMRVATWSRDTLRPLIERFPQVRTNIMREMTAHMTDALTRVRELSTERVGQRLAHTLLRLMRQCGRPTAEGILLGHPLTHQEYAELAGTTLYTVSRTLSEWKAEGILRSNRRSLVIVEPARLEALAHATDG